MKAFYWALAVLAAVVVLGVVEGSEARAPGTVTAVGIQVFGTVTAICFAIYVLWNRHNIDRAVARRLQMETPVAPIEAPAPATTYDFVKSDPVDAPQPRSEEPMAPVAVAAPIAGAAIIEDDTAHTRETDERLSHMEAAASIANHTIQLIDEAWAGVGDKSVSAMVYVTAGFSREKFVKAEAALHKIYIAQLQDSEIAKPIVELRSHVVRVASLVEGISQAEQNGRTREENAGRISLAGIREQAHGHTATIEAAVTRMRDAVE